MNWFRRLRSSILELPIVTLLQRETQVSLRPLLWTAAVSALANVLVLAVVNQAAEAATTEAGASGRDLILFLLLLGLFNVAQRYVLITAVTETEEIINRLRTRVADKVRRADLAPLERIGRAQIFTTVTRDTVTLSNTSPMIVVATQSSILLLFIALYLAYLSIPAFLLGVLLAGGAGYVYWKRSHEAFDDLRKASLGEYDFFNALSDMLDGFKSVKLHRARSGDLLARTGQISHVVKGLKVDVMTRFANLNVFGQSSFYLVVAAMVFVLPRFSDPQSDVIIKSTAAILFLIGPLTALANVLPVVTHASVAANNIVRVESALDQHVGGVPAPAPNAADRKTFEEIRFEGVAFEYQDAAGRTSFRLGPVDFSLRRGETIFLVGGNGSGKSTLLLLLTALYHPQAGRIVVDGVEINRDTVDEYRSLFSTVLSDYHLFKELYGLRHVPDATLQALLEKLEIGSKTRVVDGRFNTVDLSTGQKKRLALAVALLENRQIYIFDEWAAEQDAAFRERFYREILPELKAAGKTVVVVSHDDRYFHVEAIDRVLKLDQGQFVPFTG
jgi:putative ATP-binding cassette transporter